jgi:hypothetical protein
LFLSDQAEHLESVAITPQTPQSTEQSPITSSPPVPQFPSDLSRSMGLHPQPHVQISQYSPNLAPQVHRPSSIHTPPHPPQRALEPSDARNIANAISLPPPGKLPVMAPPPPTPYPYPQQQMTQARPPAMMMGYAQNQRYPTTYPQPVYPQYTPHQQLPRPQGLVVAPDMTQSRPIMAMMGQPVQIGGQPMQLAGQPVQMGGQQVQMGGQQVQMGGQQVQMGGQQVQMGGQQVQMGGQQVQMGGQQVQMGGQQVQMGGQQVQMGALNGQPVQMPVQIGGQQMGGQQMGGQQMGGQQVQHVQMPIQIGVQMGQSMPMMGQAMPLQMGQHLQMNGQHMIPYGFHGYSPHPQLAVPYSRDRAMQMGMQQPPLNLQVLFAICFIVRSLILVFRCCHRSLSLSWSLCPPRGRLWC